MRPNVEHISEDRLDAYCLGRLSMAEHLKVDKHLAECVACRRRIIETEEFIRELRRYWDKTDD